MKKVSVVISCFLLAIAAKAQKDFEGKIVYNLHASDDEKKGGKKDAELTILFGPQKLKIRFKERNEYDKTDVLVNLDAGKIYRINAEDKTYKVEDLPLKKMNIQLAAKEILGYNAVLLRKEPDPLNMIFGGMLGMGDANYFVADSLFYTISSKYAANPLLSAVQKNHIVLELNVSVSKGMMRSADVGDPEENDNSTITASAISVTPMQFGMEEFMVPADYSLEMHDYDEMMTADSTVMMVDTARMVAVDSAMTMPAKKPVKKSTPKPPVKKKTTTAKPSAAMRKP